jgi:hypothetical protein
MRNDQGTPKSLRLAISNGLKEEVDAENIEIHVRDFIAQKFTAVMFNPEVTPAEAERLRILFLAITKV